MKPKQAIPGGWIWLYYLNPASECSPVCLSRPRCDCANPPFSPPRVAVVAGTTAGVLGWAMHACNAEHTMPAQLPPNSPPHRAAPTLYPTLLPTLLPTRLPRLLAVWHGG